MIAQLGWGYLVFLSGYHVFTGVVSMFFPGFAMSFYKRLYGCDPVEREQLEIVLKPWGALAIFAGVVGLAAAAAPDDYAGVIWALVGLLALRVYYRARFGAQLLAVGRVPTRRNRANIAMLIAGMVILVIWRLSTR